MQGNVCSKVRRMRGRPIVWALVATLVALSAVAFRPSSAGATPTTASITISLNGSPRRLPADIARKILAHEPETLTRSQLAVPTSTVPPEPALRSGRMSATRPPSSNASAMPASRQGSLKQSYLGGVKPSGVVAPYNASKCGGYSGLLCIDVRSQGGSGNYITQWNTIWDLPANSFDCVAGYDWWGNYTEYAESETTCGYGAYATYWYPNLRLATGDAESYDIGEDYGYSGAVKFEITS